MKLEVCEYKKLESVKNDNFTELPEYMNEKSLDNARMAFRIKTEMVNKIKMNFKGSYKNNLTCDKCMAEQNETQCHAMLYPGWAEQREGLDLSRMSSSPASCRRRVARTRRRVNKKVNYYDMDLSTGPCQSSTLLRQLHSPSGGCPTGQ